MNYQKLFDHMQNEHGVTLLESEMDEIIRIANDMQKDNEMLEFAIDNGFDSWDDYVAWTKTIKPGEEISARLKPHTEGRTMSEIFGPNTPPEISKEGMVFPQEGKIHLEKVYGPASFKKYPVGKIFPTPEEPTP